MKLIYTEEFREEVREFIENSSQVHKELPVLAEKVADLAEEGHISSPAAQAVAKLSIAVAQAAADNSRAILSLYRVIHRESSDQALLSRLDSTSGGKGIVPE